MLIISHSALGPLIGEIHTAIISTPVL